MKDCRKRQVSADRTRSWRRRAGSRRNKRLRNVGSHKREFAALTSGDPS